MVEKRKPVEGSIHKQTPQRPASIPTDIYISNKSRSSAIVSRVKRLMLKENQKRVTLHGLGAMVLRASTIALAVKEALHDGIELKPITETVALTDTILPLEDEHDLGQQQRMNSVIHIHLEAKASLMSLQQKTRKIIHRPSRNRRNRVWT